ncbi:MAG: hypothetical protein ACQET1_07880 [Gemmatimonadota bacterium]
MRRLPPGPVLRSLILTALIVWVVPRAALSVGVQVVSGLLGISAGISPLVYLILATAVAFVVYLDTVASHERIFLANLGFSRNAILAVAFGTALVAEAALHLARGILPGLLGG